MSFLFRDTIFALSSGALPSGVAVVRLSGPHVRDVLIAMTGSVPPPRIARFRTIRDTHGQSLDRGIVLFFADRSSFTGEDSAEFQLHGGRAVVASVLRTLSEVPGVRQADAGEFTRRAFLNGKVDLTETEALSDLIAAETEGQRRLALRNAQGHQKVLYGDWGRRLLHARAMIEAELDFADEGDVPGSVSREIWRDMRVLSAEIESHLEGYKAAEIVRDGFKVVLIGPPNVGKSSLLNALAKRDVAIVTDVPGTTRDLVEVMLDLNGTKVIVTDTAGIRDTADKVEQIGIERALNAASGADLLLLLKDPFQPSAVVAPFPSHGSQLIVTTKRDVQSPTVNRSGLAISSTTGEGINDLLSAIAAEAAKKVAAADLDVVPSRARHRALLLDGQRHLERAITGEDFDLEIRAEELRLCANALERITGHSNVEDLLGMIFSEFCIGK